MKPMIRWYVMTNKRLNAAGQPTAQCGPYMTALKAENMLIRRREKTGDDTLHILNQDVHKLAVRPTRIKEEL